MAIKPGRENLKRYTQDQYLEHFFPSTSQPELPKADSTYELGVRLGQKSMERFVEGLRKTKLNSRG